MSTSPFRWLLCFRFLAPKYVERFLNGVDLFFDVLLRHHTGDTSDRACTDGPRDLSDLREFTRFQHVQSRVHGVAGTQAADQAADAFNDFNNIHGFSLLFS